MWALKNTYFYPDYYFESNADLHQSIEKNDLDGLWSHYILHGWEEGRFPFDVHVDDIFYQENYPDVSFFDGSSQEHFVKHGYKEGRLPYRFNLNLEDYKTIEGKNNQRQQNGRIVTSSQSGMDDSKQNSLESGDNILSDMGAVFKSLVAGGSLVGQ